MTEIDPNEIETAYVKFCEIMGLNEKKWNSILEFTGLVGFDLLDIRDFTASDYSTTTSNQIRVLNGPHAETILKAYKVRRNTLRGTLHMMAIKPAHMVGYLCFAIIGTWKQFKHEW